MNFVTVGMQRFPFDRLIRAIDDLCAQGHLNNLHCQIGASTYQPKHGQWRSFFPFSTMLKYIRKSEVVIAHAGAGITVLCLQENKIPILVPRQKKWGEHVDDHQVKFAARMDELNKAVMVLEVENLMGALEAQKKLQARYIEENCLLDEKIKLDTKNDPENNNRRLSLCQELETVLASWQSKE